MLDKLPRAVRPIIPATLVLLIGIAASLAVSLAFKRAEDEKARRDFEGNARDKLGLIEQRLTTEIAVTGTLRSLFGVSDGVSPDKFRDFSGPLLARNNYLQALQWVPRVKNSQRAAFESAAKSAGLKNFVITEQSAPGILTPAKTREEYFPVRYVEPLAGNELSVGLDLASYDRQLAALKHARDTGAPVGTVEIAPNQKSGEQSNLQVFNPVYAGKGNPGSIDDRRQRLRGFGLTVIRIGNLVQSVIGSDPGLMDLRILDVTGPKSQEVFLRSEKVDFDTADLRYSKDIRVAGRTWKIDFAPIAPSHWPAAWILPVSAFLTGLVLTIIVSSTIFRALLDLEAARREVAAKTIALNESERALKEQEHDLKEANDHLNRFAFIASHDLQEPLRKLMQFSNYLQTDCGDELSGDGKYFVEVISNSSARMSQLIRDVGIYSKAHSRNLEPAEILLSDMVQELLCDPELQVAETNARIHVGALPIIRADRAAMEQLLRNLIVNAIKFRKPGQEPQIDISCLNGGQNSATEIRIADNGIGFDMQFSERILEPFRRLHGRDEYSGTGLGLAICKSVCDRHGWLLNISSEPDKGSTFSIVIKPHALV